MERHVDWPRTLDQCRIEIQERISSYLGSPSINQSDRPESDLGIGAGGDRMKPVDLMAENAIVETLRENGISFTLISEESGTRRFGPRPEDRFVTVDPIDGTTNLERGIPFYATSIAVSTEPTLTTIHTAMIADLAHDLTYTAQLGTGAHRNDETIKPSSVTDLDDAVIGIDLNTFHVDELVPSLTKLVQKVRHIRHFGANALELCYVADGTSDAFLDMRGKLRTTDIAAGWLIAKEAGVRLSRLGGDPMVSKLGPRRKLALLASCNLTLHKTILKLVRAEDENQ